MKVVLASNNAGKIRELNELLKDFKITLIAQNELGIHEIEETATTFVENALIKAHHAAKLSGLPAIADDSGLVVPILKGAPGIYSARHAGKCATDADNIQKLLSDLHDIPDDKRDAFYYCSLVYLSYNDDPIPLICHGKWSGKILHRPKGCGGFGYDPLFYVPTENKTAAELESSIKNKISHRGLALQSMLKQLPDKL